MNKYISTFAMALTLSLGFTACDVETDEKPGGTAIQDWCGNWQVSVSQVDENGELLFAPEDLFGLIDIPLYTFNTAANSTTEMWIDDRREFWDFKFRVTLNPVAGTFTAVDVPYNTQMQAYADSIAVGRPVTDVDDEGNTYILEPEKATISDAKILLGQGHNIHGVPTDSISFYISFTDDGYASQFGYAKHHVTGTRYSGFTE